MPFTNHFLASSSRLLFTWSLFSVNCTHEYGKFRINVLQQILATPWPGSWYNN